MVRGVQRQPSPCLPTPRREGREVAIAASREFEGLRLGAGQRGRRGGGGCGGEEDATRGEEAPSATVFLRSYDSLDLQS